jgi:glycosyltransferase involved in cell wall biosynthesis
LTAIKLWLLTTEYPPQSGGGISTYCRHTAKMLADAGVEVTVFIPHENSKPVTILQEEDKIRLVYFRQHGNDHDSFLGRQAALSYQFSVVLKEFQDREGTPDYIESQEYGGIAYYPLQRRLLEEGYLPDTVFYVTAHAPGFLYLDYNQAPSYRLPEYWTGEMEKSVLRSADFILSPSKYLLDQLNDYVEISPNTSAVVRNPFLPDQRQSEFTPGDIVFFGKLTPQKGGLEMLRYFSDMWDEGFSGTLRVIGGGEHFFYPKGMDVGEYIKKKFRGYAKRGLLTFEGHVSPRQLESRLSKAHLVVIPSVVDNLPYTVLEAMSLGKLVLASNQGGQAELIENGKNGFLFSHTNPQSFRIAMESIWQLSKSEILLIGESARQTIVERCNYTVIGAQKLSLIKSVKSEENIREFPFIRSRPRKLQIPENNNYKPGLLSVVIPYYNLGRYIQETIDAVLSSEYKSIEVLIVNDGSTDVESLNALKKIEDTYPVKVVHTKNQGVSAARNTGAAQASGEFLSFLDADDTVSITYYSKAIRVLKEYDNVSFVGCWAQYFGNDNRVWPAFNPEPPYLLVHNMINSSALVYKTPHFLVSGLNDPEMVYGMEDYESVINMVERGFRGVALPEILWRYRIRQDSMAQSFNVYTEQYLYRLISKKHAAFFSEYAELIVNILNANGPGMLYENPTNFGNRILGARPGSLFEKIVFTVARVAKRNAFLRKIAFNFYKFFLPRP